MPKEGTCPHCGSVAVSRCGKAANGSQRYLCADCGRTFSDATGTVMSSLKLEPWRLRLMVNLMANDTKLKAISDAIHASTRTVYVWRMKVYAVAAEIQKSVRLSGKVWIDEKLIPVNRGLAATGSSGKMLRGVSRNQVCVACAVDERGGRVAVVAGRGHITSRQCITAYGPHIEKGSLIVHDGIFSHDRLISFLGSASEVHKSTARGSHSALQPVNSLTAEIAHFMAVHPGIRTEYLQPYMSWIAMRPSLKGVDSDEIVEELVRMCFETEAVFKVKDRYKLG